MLTKEKYTLKGFTIVEVLVSLALTSVAITMSYSTLNYVQKLFYNYKKQNKFISEYTDLKNRLDYESLKSDLITENDANDFTIKRDSLTIFFKIKSNNILLQKSGRCDTFHIQAKKIIKEYEPINNPLLANKLLRSIRFEVEFSKQKFNFYFYKKYDSFLKLTLEKKD